MPKFKANLILVLWIIYSVSTAEISTSKPLTPAVLITPGSAKSTINTNQTVSFVPKDVNQSPQVVSVASEGGNVVLEESKAVHRGREHVTEKPFKITINTLNTSTSGNLTISKNKSNVHTSEKVIPVREEQDLEIPFSKKNDGKQIVSRKGVNYTEAVSNSELKNTSEISKVLTTVVSSAPPPSSTKEPPHKPLYTEPGDEADIKNSKVSDDEAILKQNDTFENDKKKKRSEYIIPIVAVILSVPLVAITTSFLYKRSKYWWQHRNYRRMDFLIEGMYHN